MQETSEQYVARMYGYVGKENPLELQAAAPGRLARLLELTKDADARQRPAPNKWSISEIVTHLADTELVMGYRIRAILGAPGIQIIGFDQDSWVSALHYDKREMTQSLAQYKAFRDANVVLLRLLTPEQWKQKGMHNERGPQDVDTIVRMTAGHDLNHFQQIQKILAAGK